MSYSDYHDDDEDEEALDSADSLDADDEPRTVSESGTTTAGSESNDFLLTDVTQIYFNEIGHNALLTRKKKRNSRAS